MSARLPSLFVYVSVNVSVDDVEVFAISPPFDVSTINWRSA